MFDCCEDMQQSIDKKRFKFYPQYRGVCCYFFSEPHNDYGMYFIKYCPFCGAKMPEHLCGEREDELEKAVGKSRCDITDDEIPEEFKTDEWWKKRGL